MAAVRAATATRYAFAASESLFSIVVSTLTSKPLASLSAFSGVRVRRFGAANLEARSRRDRGRPCPKARFAGALRSFPQVSASTLLSRSGCQAQGRELGWVDVFALGALLAFRVVRVRERCPRSVFHRRRRPGGARPGGRCPAGARPGGRGPARARPGGRGP